LLFVELVCSAFRSVAPVLFAPFCDDIDRSADKQDIGNPKTFECINWDIHNAFVIVYYRMGLKGDRPVPIIFACIGKSVAER